MKTALRVGISLGAIGIGVGGLMFMRSAVDDELQHKLVAPAIATDIHANAVPKKLAKKDVEVTEDPYSKAAYKRLIAAFNAGNFDGALKFGNDDLKDTKLTRDYLAWLQQQMPVLYNSSGWLRIQQGKYEEAVDFLQHSLEFTKSAEAYKGLSLCFYKLKQMFDADINWRNYAKFGGVDSHMLLLHADILESIGDYEEAVTNLDEVAASKQELPMTADEFQRKRIAMLAKVREAGHQTNINSEHFSLTYRVQDHDKLAPLCLDLLENAYEALRSEFGLGDLKGQLEVVLYPEERFQILVANSPAWAGGIFDGRLRLPISKEMIQSPDPAPLMRKVVRHELSHAMFADQVDRRRIPPWFSEGFAQFVECTKGCGFMTFPMMTSNFLNAASFLQDFIALDRGAAEKSYRQSLYLVLVMHKSPMNEEGPDRLRVVVEAMTRSSSLDSEAILKPIGLNFENLVKVSSIAWSHRTKYPPGSAE